MNQKTAIRGQPVAKEQTIRTSTVLQKPFEKPLIKNMTSSKSSVKEAMAVFQKESAKLPAEKLR